MQSNLPNTEDDEAEQIPANLDVDATRHLKSITGIVTDLIDALGDSHVHERYRERRSQTVWKLQNLKSRATALRKHSDLVCWLEQQDDGKDFTLASIPMNLDERLYQDIWSQDLPAPTMYS